MDHIRYLIDIDNIHIPAVLLSETASSTASIPLLMR